MSLINNKRLSIQITDTSINILIGNKNKIYETHTIELENGDCRDGNIRDKESIIKLLNHFFFLPVRRLQIILPDLLLLLLHHTYFLPPK